MTANGYYARVFQMVILLLMLLPAVATAAPQLLIDQAHGQRFLVEKDGPLHLSSFAAIMQDEGYTVTTGTERFSEESLRGIDVVVISGAFAPLDKAETEAVEGFIARGGRLAVMLHIASPVVALLHQLGADVSNYVVNEQEYLIENDPRNFQVKNLRSHPLFAGVAHFSVYGGWALMNAGDSTQMIAATSPRSWVDLNGDRKLTPGDAEQSFGIVIAGKSGAGRFVLFGDDAIFQNRFLDEQNRQLAKNLARWLK